MPARGGDSKKPSGRRCDADLDEKCLDRLGVCVYNELNFTEAMIEKQTVQFFRELPDGARQQAGRAFRSGAANDEFDGSARYSGQSWPYGKLGGNAGFRLPSLEWDGSFFVFQPAANWVVPRERRSSSQKRASPFVSFFPCREE